MCFIVAAFVSLRSIIMVELMGIEKLSSSFGLVVLCQGLSSFLGPPVTGKYHIRGFEWGLQRIYTFIFSIIEIW